MAKISQSIQNVKYWHITPTNDNMLYLFYQIDITIIFINNKNIQMLHQSDPNQYLSNPRTIKLSSNSHSKAQTGIRTLKSTLINYKDSISHTKNNNDIMQNRSMNIQRKDSQNDGSNQKWDKVVTHHQPIVNNNWSRQSQNQRDSLLGASREIRRISNETDQTLHRSNQKNVMSGHNFAQFKTPSMRKEQSQFTRPSQGMPAESLSTQERSNYQMQIQELMNKIQYFQNQCRNLKNQNDHLHRSLGAPKEILQRQLENKAFRIDDVEKRLTAKNKQFLDKCLQNQKHLAKVTQLESAMKRLQHERNRISGDLQRSKQGSEKLTKMLNDARTSIAKLQSERKKILLDIQDQRMRSTHLVQQKRQLQMQIDKIQKIKQMVKQLQQSDDDKAEIIKKHIAYEAQLIDLNCIMASNLQSHKHDLKVTTDQHSSINKEIESMTKQIAAKLKDVLLQKDRLEQQLAEARAETERIRKTMFVGYQEVINRLKEELLQLKQENINLTNNSQSRITVAKLEREITISQNRIEDLMKRNKEMQQAFERLQQSENQHKRTISELSSETSIKGPQYFDRNGQTQLQDILMGYQTSRLDLNDRIHQKELQHVQLKRRIEELEQEIQQYRDQAQLSSRRDKADNNNINAKIESMKMELKAQTDSLNRKIQALEKNIQRKNKEIKEKDNFITQYLIQRVKGEAEVNQIVMEIDKFFQPNQAQ